VPADRKSCVITQGIASITVAVLEGAAEYDALRGGEVVLKKAP
jgi:hypothetical protein